MNKGSKAALTILLIVLFFLVIIFFGWTSPVGASIAVYQPTPYIYDEEYIEPFEPVIIETLIEEPVEEEVYVEPVDYEPEPVTEYPGAVYEDGVYIEGVLTKSGGVNYYNGRRETWYSQRVLPGGGLNIPGRHVGANGLIYDGDGYICVAADDLAYGTVVETSLGMGKVYDCGVGSDNAVDIYCDW